jgi:proline dehydrogenase
VSIGLAGNLDTLKRTTIRILYKLARYIAPSYIAGEHLSDALRVCHKYHQQGWNITICPWEDGSDTSSNATQRYVEALNAIQKESFDSYISVKAPFFGYSLRYLLQIVQAAKSKETKIHFDSLHPESAQLTFKLLNEAIKVYPNLGCTLPARWDRSLADVNRIIEAQCSVRIVKGQWEDPQNPKIDIDKRYIEIVRALAGKVPFVAIASHDPKLVESCLDILVESNTQCELELLYGLPMGVARIADEKGVAKRIYVPYGMAFLPYALGEIKKRPRILLWIVRDSLAKTFGFKS